MIGIFKIAFLSLLIFLIASCSNEENSQETLNSEQIFQISDGLEVSLIAPSGYKLTAEHYGFVQPESFSRIRISEKETPYIPYTNNLTKEYLLKNQLQLINNEKIDIHGAICTLLTLRQNIAGTYFEKLWLIAGDNLSSVKIEASYPEGASNKHKTAIKNSLLTLNVVTDKSKRIFVGLPFLLKNTPGFRIKKRFANSILLLPLSDKDLISSVVISHGITKQSVEDIQTLSEHFLKNSKHFKNVQILNNQMIKLNKIPALATIASVEINKLPTQIYQILSYQKDRFLLIQGQSSVKDSDHLKSKIDELLKYFEFR